MFNTFAGDFLVICYTFTGDFLVNYHTFTGDFSCQRYKKAMMMQNFSNQKIALKADVFAVCSRWRCQSAGNHLHCTFVGMYAFGRNHVDNQAVVARFVGNRC